MGGGSREVVHEICVLQSVLYSNGRIEFGRFIGNTSLTICIKVKQTGNKTVIIEK